MCNAPLHYWSNIFFPLFSARQCAMLHLLYTFVNYHDNWIIEIIAYNSSLWLNLCAGQLNMWTIAQIFCKQRILLSESTSLFLQWSPVITCWNCWFITDEHPLMTWEVETHKFNQSAIFVLFMRNSNNLQQRASLAGSSVMPLFATAIYAAIVVDMIIYNCIIHGTLPAPFPYFTKSRSCRET